MADTKHKVFISFYHFDDEKYKDALERDFGHLMICKSVGEGEIDEDNSDDYIKRLIREEHITDASVVVVLIGPNTRKRKHVDWELYAGLTAKAGGHTFSAERARTADPEEDASHVIEICEHLLS